MKKLLSIAALVLGLTLTSWSAQSQTPDGMTPANEGVCDELLGATPGLYGLCVGFSEAQDCVADFNPNTGELILDPSCKPSSQKLLQNYNKRRTADDPHMPGLNITGGGCPCWTEPEIDDLVSWISANSPSHAIDDVFDQTYIVSLNSLFDYVFVIDRHPQVCGYTRYPFSPIWDLRYLAVTPTEFSDCKSSIIDAAQRYGIPPN